MKSSNKWARNSRAIARSMTVLVLAVVIVGMSITPVLAKNDRGYHGRKAYHGRGAYYAREGYRGPGGYEQRGGYYYPAPVYAPPPVVYYPPPPPPGISFVFPIRIR